VVDINDRESLEQFDPDNEDELFGYEIFDETDTRSCHSCFGTGMDKYEDADCLVCFGDGVY